MAEPSDGLFDVKVWEPALEKYGAVTHLTVMLYDRHERIVCGPVPSTPLFALFEEFGYAPGIVAECARQCLAQAETRPAVVVAPSYGLAGVGTSLVLDGTIVGAAVAAYALVDFSQSSAVARLARQAGVPFQRLWDIARHQQPIPQRRLVLHGELLQVLGDSLLRENYRTRQYEDAATRLKTEMAAKDDFLAILSHELRTPLTPILGWAQVLKRVSEDPVQREQAADSIERNARLQIKLVDDLLDLNRVMRDKVTLDIGVHDLTDLLRSALDTMGEAAATQGIDMQFSLPERSLPVEADAGRLEQVFINILSNAVKFTPTGGRIRVSVEQVSGTAIVRIMDTGEGIEEAFLPHVFEIFRQQEEGTRRQFGGLGIGLAVVKRLVEMHGGRVDVASRGVGHGTQVAIQLPLAVGTAKCRQVQSDRTATTVNTSPLRDLTILVVEDVEDNLQATRRLLEVLGADVLVARSGLKALSITSTESPDLVLCDLSMPQMDGFEFLHRLQQIHGNDHPPVVAMSGLVSQANRQRTEAAGFGGHLAKPFDEVELIEAVRGGLRHRSTA
jgi:hypothetical protein